MAGYPSVPTPPSIVDKAKEVKKAIATGVGFVAVVGAAVAATDTSTVQNLILGLVGIVTTATTYYAKNVKA